MVSSSMAFKADLSVSDMNLILSRASDAFEISSRRNIWREEEEEDGVEDEEDGVEEGGRGEGRGGKKRQYVRGGEVET